MPACDGCCNSDFSCYCTSAKDLITVWAIPHSKGMETNVHARATFIDFFMRFQLGVSTNANGLLDRVWTRPVFLLESAPRSILNPPA